MHTPLPALSTCSPTCTLASPFLWGTGATSSPFHPPPRNHSLTPASLGWNYNLPFSVSCFCRFLFVPGLICNDTIPLMWPWLHAHL